MDLSPCFCVFLIIQKILLFFQRKIKILRSPGAHKNVHEQIKLRFAHG